MSDNNCELVEIKNFAETAYLAYAMSVVKGRALPQVEDGQKPVQRRIIYAMYQMGMDEKSKHVKSARIVGETLGKFHPHGDSSVYEAMVRMAQEFTLRYPLMDGQGNFGSRDGDGAAAMRYTEIRLSPISSLFLDEIKQNTVDFIPNYDGVFDEPVLLPARLPFLLLNGASGIAVGMATDIPSHNLNEVADACVHLIKNKDAGLDDVMDIIKGPDFANGGQIISSHEEIKKCYEGGRGSVRVRARWNIEKLSDGTPVIVIYNLPQNSSTAKLLIEIDSYISPKPKAGKNNKLTPDQIALKNKVSSLIEKIRDGSSQHEPVRIIIEAKSSLVNPQDIINFLCVYTSFEQNFSLNMVMIGVDKKPKQKGIVNIINEWIHFRTSTVIKKLSYRLNQIDARLHVLEGRILAVNNIDKIIHIIKNEENPKEALMSEFSLSDIQAEDILEMKLRQISNLEGTAIENQARNLNTEKQGILTVLSTQENLDNFIIKEIEADKERFGDDRRTIIEESEKGSIDLDVTTSEPATIIISNNGWLRSRSGHRLDAEKLDFKAGDSLYKTIEVKSNQTLAIVNKQGALFNIKVSEIPSGRGDGRHIGSMISNLNIANIDKILPVDTTKKYLVISEDGYGFICKGADLITRSSGKSFASLNEGYLLYDIKEVDDSKTHIQFMTNTIGTKGGFRMLSYLISEIKELPKGKGTRLIDAIDVGIDCIEFVLIKNAKDSLGKRGQKGKFI
jgi:topoisomerase-4 subunit A